MWLARNMMEHGTTTEERSRAQRSRMNARLRIAYAQQSKVSPVQQTQLFNIPLTRRQQYKLTANERWLDSVDAARRNKKRHEERQAKRDRNIRVFFGPTISISSIHSTTASPYLRSNHRQTVLQVPTTIIANISKNHSPPLPIEPTYAGIQTTESRTRNIKISQNLKEHAIHLHELLRITHRKTKNSRIWDHFKMKAA